jgi:hypothetical protein
MEAAFRPPARRRLDKDSRDCPVAAALTDADRAKLLRIKRDAENEDK